MRPHHKPIFSKIWKSPDVDATAADALAAATGLPAPVARLLAMRGISTPEQMDSFLKPRLSALRDPFLLPGMEAAVGRIWRAVDAGERVAVYGDYDVDGITSAALLLDVLGRLGAKASPFLPHRMEEGYGLTHDALVRCIEEIKPALIVTVDCGTNSPEVVEQAREAGIDVVVTDHHEPGERVVKACAVVNPKLGGQDGDMLLAGVGVTFKLCHALLKRGREAGREKASFDLREHLDLVALGTVADIVPLRGENRTFVRHGLKQIAETKKAGLRELMRVAAVEGEIDTADVGFKIGPRLNAAGRLGDALNALELLGTTDLKRAIELAAHLDKENRSRQAVEFEIMEEAIAEIDGTFDPASHFGLVVAREGWHPGVVGIVASRLTQRYARPAVVIAMGEERGRGSCRGVEDMDLFAVLTECGDLLAKFGGHAMAAGLEIGRDQVGPFSEKFNQVVARTLAGRDLRPVQRVDVWLDSLADANFGLVDKLEELRPFGLGNATPVWGCRNVRPGCPPRKVGDGKHLKLTFGQGSAQTGAIWFGAGEEKLPEGPLDVAFQLRRGFFMGAATVDLLVQDVRAAGEK